MSSKTQINALAPEIISKIKLSGIHWMGWKVKFALREELVSVGERFAGAFGGSLKAGRVIVDAADKRHKSLHRAQLIGLRIAQHQKSDGVFSRVKGLLATALVTGVGCYLISVPEGKCQEHQETSGQGGADSQDDERDGQKRDRPSRPPFRLLVGSENAECRGDEEPGQRRPLAKRQKRGRSELRHLETYILKVITYQRVVAILY